MDMRTNLTILFLLLFFSGAQAQLYMGQQLYIGETLPPSGGVIITNFVSDVPVFSNELVGGSSTIANSQFIEDDVSTFRYHNGHYIFGGLTGNAWGPNKATYLTTYPLPIGGINNAVAIAQPRAMAVSFDYYPPQNGASNQFEFAVSGGTYEMVVGTNISNYFYVGTTNASNCLVMCTFSNSWPKHITLRTSAYFTNTTSYGYFGGVYAPSNSVVYDTRPTNATMMVLGDSFATGYSENHATNNEFGGYPWLLVNNWTNVDLLDAGSSGTGFVFANGSWGSYTNRVWQEVVTNQPQYLIVQGSPINETSLTTNACYSGATNFFAVVVSNCPNTKIICLTGWNEATPTAFMTNYCIAIGGAAAQFGIPYYSPALSNCPSSFDVVHPSPTGYAQMESLLYSIVTNNWGPTLWTNNTPSPVPSFYDGSGYPFITGVTVTGATTNNVTGEYGYLAYMLPALTTEYWTWTPVALGLYAPTNTCTNSQSVGLWNNTPTLIASNMLYPSGNTGWAYSAISPVPTSISCYTRVYVGEAVTNGSNPFLGSQSTSLSVTPVGILTNASYYTSPNTYPAYIIGTTPGYGNGPVSFKWKTP
jgi:hypothetical protein